MSNGHVDSDECPECYTPWAPRPCKCGKGWVHNEFVEEDYDNVYTRNFCSNPDCEEDITNE